MELPSYVVLEKAIGETPLSCTEAWRSAAGVDASVPLAYAGRLDPMASGKLLVLIGDECKNQTDYHGLDKGYDFSVLLGIGSDTHDVLGRLQVDESAREDIEIHPPKLTAKRVFQDITGLDSSLAEIAKKLTGDIELPYPHFSAKTVASKPLHMWTLEGRLDEIDIPTKQSTIYSLELTSLETKSRTDVCNDALAKISTIPPVTEARKALGNDFRRTGVRADWEQIRTDDSLPDEYTIAHFHCIASSGTYMRTLAHIIGKKLDTHGLAWHIHRTDVGIFDPDSKTWTKTF